jgi:uracil-DNA glycosylase
MHRAIRQQLESLLRAGMTHLPRGEAVAPPAPVPVKAPAVANPPSVQAAPIRIPAVPAPPPPAVPPTAAPVTRVAAEVPATPPGLGFSPAEPTTPEQALAVLNQQVAACQRCPELASQRTKTVFGVGNPRARILFLGEAPGADEDRQGIPFVGAAGQLLDQIIVASRLKREELYICNVLKCRPPNNRTPEEIECANCREYLLGQLAAIDPEYIVCWGAVAAQNLLQNKLSVGKLRGKFHSYGRAKVLCTYHPSYLLRTPTAKKDVWADMQFLMKDMGVDLKAKS